MRNTGIWIWYNGDKAYIYGQNIGNICETGYSPAYAVNTDTGVQEGYDCILPLESVMDFYKSKGEMKFIYTNVGDRNSFDIYGVLNLMSDRGIINMNE